MFERFTDRARRAMQFAAQEAQRLKHDHLGTEHLLLGLLKEGTGVGAGVLYDCGLDLDKLRNEVERRSHGPNTANPPTNPRQTSRLLRVFDYANEESAALHHDYIGTEHLLLGIMREPESCAAKSLAALNCTPDVVRSAIVRPGAEKRTGADALRELAMRSLNGTVPDTLASAEAQRAVVDALINAGWRPPQ